MVTHNQGVHGSSPCGTTKVKRKTKQEESTLTIVKKCPSGLEIPEIILIFVLLCDYVRN